MQGVGSFLNRRETTPTTPDFSRGTFLNRISSVVPVKALIDDLSLYDRELFHLKRNLPTERKIPYPFLPLPLKKKIDSVLDRIEKQLPPYTSKCLFLCPEGKYEGYLLKADRPYYLFLSYGRKEHLFKNLSELRQLKSFLPDFPEIDHLIEKNNTYLYCTQLTVEK